MNLMEIFKAVSEMAKLGASPAIQQLFLATIAKMQGISQGSLDAFLKAEQEAQDPKVA